MRLATKTHLSFNQLIMKVLNAKGGIVFLIVFSCFSKVAWGQIHKTIINEATLTAMKNMELEESASASNITLKAVNYRVPIVTDYQEIQRANSVMQAEAAAAAAQQAAREARIAAIQRIYSRDLWRVMNGATNLAKGPGWMEFEGKLVAVRPDGILFKGYWGPVAEIDYSASPRLFMVKNFPYQAKWDENNGYTFIATDGSLSTTEKLAHYEGNYEYRLSPNESTFIPQFDYGVPCEKIWSPEEIAAMKERVEGPRREAQLKALKFNQEQADQGDQYGLLRMGERYRDGEGVAKDLSKARDYLQKAAKAGSSAATNELLQLDSQTLASH